MAICITSDSTCDLGHLVQERDIKILPLQVNLGADSYLDGVDVTPADIFAHVAAGGDLCSTAAVSIGEYQELFEQYSKEYDAVIHVNIGSGFSACHQNACLAAEEYDNVRCIDSMNLSSGQGLVVLKACELAEKMDDLDVICDSLREYTTKVESSFLVDKLDYLVKGGRCSSAAALGANLLNLKPCIEVRDGKMSVVKKYRGNYAKCLASYVRERLTGREDLDLETLFVTQAVVSADCQTAVMDALAECNRFANTYETNTGCTVSCHCGPGTLGILFARK